MKQKEQISNRIRNAKKAISEADPLRALQELSKIKNRAIQIEVPFLKKRLSQYHQKTIRGAQNREEDQRTFNKINADIILFISQFEHQLEDDSIKETIKDYLNQRYQKRLSQKLAGRQPINLRKLPSTKGTSEESSAIFVAYRREEIRDEITKVFSDSNGRLLIVGDPGVGKSTLLLQLELGLLESQIEAIPVILNLASWQRAFLTLESWLERILHAELGVNKALSQKILSDYSLVLLLDGFDEIPISERSSCLEAIGKYGANRRCKFVITSRIDEYVEISNDAPIFSQIEVGSLTIEQIESELEKQGYKEPEALPLLQAIQIDEGLKKIAQIPFYFNVLQFLFAHGKRIKDLNFSTKNEENRNRKVVEAFIGLVIEPSNKTKQKTKKTKEWLAFIANGMNQNNLVTLELVDLQYNWSEWPKGKLRIAWIVNFINENALISMIIGLLVGLVKYILLDFKEGLTFGLITTILTFIVLVYYYGDEEKNTLYLFSSLIGGAIIVGLFSSFFGTIIGVVFGILFGSILMLYLVAGNQCYRSKLTIKTKDKINWSRSQFSNEFIMIMNDSIIAAVSFFAFSGLLLCPVLIEDPIKISSFSGNYFAKIAALVILGLAVGTLLGIIIGSLGGLLLGLFLGFYNQWDKNNIGIEQINTPYQRFMRSIRSFHFPIIMHIMLRYQLSQKGLIPIKFVTFLNEMADNHLLESDGATWRFRHRILQDYFAEMWKREYENEGNSKWEV